MKSNRYFNWVTLVLVALLVISNAYWLYNSFDTAVTLSYRDDHIQQVDAALTQAQQLLPVAYAAKDKATFVVAVQELLNEESFAKDGCIWIGRLGFKFDDAESLQHVSRTWNSDAPDPCYPE